MELKTYSRVLAAAFVFICGITLVCVSCIGITGVQMVALEMFHCAVALSRGIRSETYEWLIAFTSYLNDAHNFIKNNSIGKVNSTTDKIGKVDSATDELSQYKCM